MPKKTSALPSGLSVSKDLMWGSWATFTLAAAVQLDIFTAIGSGQNTAAQVAAAASANENAMRRLLDALVALKYLTRRGERYALTPASATFLARNSDLYMEGIGEFASQSMMGWAQMASAVRLGHSPVTIDRQTREQFFQTLVKCIFPLNYVGARSAVAKLDRGSRTRIHKILDVAGGAAAWSIPFAQALKNARVTVADYPGVAQVAREYTAKFGVAERFDYLEGDLQELDLGEAAFDLVILGHIIHGVGREGGQRLIERSARALRERGHLLIGEFIPNDDRTGPPIPMLFGLLMLISTPAGDVFTMREYREWLRAAGFKKINTIRTPATPSPLILATK